MARACRASGAKFKVNRMSRPKSSAGHVKDRGTDEADASSGWAQASEEELFSLFSPIGEILELYILRNSNGKSRGCAFVTYANKYLAQQAITQLNGKQVRCSEVVFASDVRAEQAKGSSMATMLTACLK